MKMVAVITANKGNEVIEVRSFDSKKEARKTLASEYGFLKTSLSNETWVGEVHGIVGYRRAQANLFTEREWYGAMRFAYNC